MDPEMFLFPPRRLEPLWWVVIGSGKIMQPWTHFATHWCHLISLV